MSYAMPHAPLPMDVRASAWQYDYVADAYVRWLSVDANADHYANAVIIDSRELTEDFGQVVQLVAARQDIVISSLRDVIARERWLTPFRAVRNALARIWRHP